MAGRPSRSHISHIAGWVTQESHSLFTTYLRGDVPLVLSQHGQPHSTGSITLRENQAAGLEAAYREDKDWSSSTHRKEHLFFYSSFFYQKKKKPSIFLDNIQRVFPKVQNHPSFFPNQGGSKKNMWTTYLEKITGEKCGENTIENIPFGKLNTWQTHHTCQLQSEVKEVTPWHQLFFLPFWINCNDCNNKEWTLHFIKTELSCFH